MLFQQVPFFFFSFIVIAYPENQLGKLEVEKVWCEVDGR